MNIGIYLGNQSPNAGGGYSLTETIKTEILKYDGKHNLFVFYSSISANIKFFKNNITYINLWPNRIKRIFSNYIFNKNGIDLMFFLFPVKVKCNIPFIFTVWDLGHRMLPNFPETSHNGQFEKRERMYQYMLPRATYVLTGNETGKKEILANYSINAEKIIIAPFPVTDFCLKKTDVPHKIDFITEPFVFYPAQFWTHKNHVAIIKAINYLKTEKNIKINCYFAGSDQGNLENVKNRIKDNDLDEQIKVLGFVDYETLMYLYKNALAMVYVSLLGPNNLPPLEAAALGCPLIISNIPGHIEQMEGTGLLVNPFEPGDIGEAILKIYNQPEFRNNMIAKGLSFAEKFKTYSYLQKVLKIVEQYEVRVFR